MKGGSSGGKATGGAMHVRVRAWTKKECERIRLEEKRDAIWCACMCMV